MKKSKTGESTMSGIDSLQPSGEKIRQTVLWISETVKAHPEKKRRDILREAQVRFDLSPKECEFVDKKLCDDNELS
jgi:hypothetical protein